jgi:hypothetical protein
MTVRAAYCKRGGKKRGNASKDASPDNDFVDFDAAGLKPPRRRFL